MLKYLHDRGAPFDAIELINAAQNGHFEIVKWLYENNCPRSHNVYKCAKKYDHLEIARWIRNH